MEDDSKFTTVSQIQRTGGAAPKGVETDAAVEHDARLERLVTVNLQLIEENKELQHYKTQKDQVAALTARLEDAERKSTELDSQRLAELSRITDESASLKLVNEKLMDRARQLEQENETLQHDIARTQAELQTMVHDAQHLRRTEMELQSRNLQLNSEIEKLLRHVSALRNADAPDYTVLGEMLRAELTKPVSSTLRRYIELLLEEHASWRKFHEAENTSEGLEVRSDELASLFDPYHPISLLDVDGGEVFVASNLACAMELFRKSLLTFLKETGIEPIRPVPCVSKFDAALHEDIPSHRRSTALENLDGLVAQRIGVGILERNEDGTTSVLRKAQVGRFVYSPR